MVIEFNDEGRGVLASQHIDRSMSLETLMQSSSVDFVDVDDGAIIVVEAPTGSMRSMSHGLSGTNPDEVDVAFNAELGRSGTVWSNFLREEYNPELVGQAGLIKYERMSKSDAAVRSALRAVKTPILGATWFVQPAHNDPLSVEIARFVSRNLTQYMTYQWSQVLWEALLMLNYGHYLFELVWDFRDVTTDSGTSRKVVLKKMAPRHPLDITQWGFDVHGGPRFIEVFGPPTGALSGVGFTSSSPFGGESVAIPIEKLAIFTFDWEGGDLRGISVLRSAYKHWFFRENLYKIDAIQKERHGIGIPIIKLPAGFTNNDRTLAHELGANLRTNEKAHVVLPPNWELMFAKLEGQPVDALESADHHMKMIYQNVLAQAIVAGTSGGAAKEGMELFYKSTRYIADIVRGVMNKYVIPKLVLANWPVDEFPELKVRRLGDTQEARTISFAVRNLIGAGVIQVDDRFEEWAREIIDAPQMDPTTRRTGLQSPQVPGGGGGSGNLTPPDENVGPARVGMPRQTPTDRSEIEPRNRPGADRSGG